MCRVSQVFILLCYVLLSQVRFSVPKDAVQLDFVFSNVPGGDGIYDNRGGFDYHLPIKVGNLIQSSSLTNHGSVFTVGAFTILHPESMMGLKLVWNPPKLNPKGL